MLAALDAFDKACEADLAAFARELEAEESPPMLFHYTDDAGLKGILEYGNIRLTDVLNLNDPAELRHGFSHAIDVWERAQRAAHPKARCSLSSLNGF